VRLNNRDKAPLFERRLYLGGPAGVVVVRQRSGRYLPSETMLDGMDVRGLWIADPAELMYAQVADTILRSSDGGQTWDRVFAPIGKIFAFLCDPAHPATAYVGLEPVALYRTRDAGDTWEELDSVRRQPESVRDHWWSPAYPHEAHVRDVCIDPDDRARIYVALEHGGIMRSDDDGRNWENLSDGFETLDIHNVRVHPRHAQLVYAATARGMYRSEDGGRGWVRTADGLSFDHTGAFAVSTGASVSLFVSAARGTPPSWARPTGAEACVFRSDDDGMTWRRLGGGLPVPAPSPFRALLVDPLDPDRIYLATAEPHATIWGSADRGESWSVLCEAPYPCRLLSVAAARPGDAP
jgi:photosystem II stability/assembly factor-like uncharacterized protein